ncbi:UBX domain-containing protein 7 [Eurytemora carolleeae]|uniref:UBX domain-containing protein 7 n=1 Tax=Eurytemora carolleeae TaxID=1294199 RepID=UPI000C78F0CC|nr:UBX domain-containing protein 7 [Eurytemora carolleeae]|eukprot:XP_023330095.1 UBX domain-containing protein 7-like [Eurytemora affinis]
MRTDHVADMDEEAQLAAAIKASLVETLAASNPQEEEDDISLGGWEDESDSNLLPGSNPVNGRLEDTGSNPVNGRLEGTGEPEKGEPCKAVNGGGDESWKKYLGSTDDPLTSILIRFPDGSKDPWNPPATSKLKALVLFVGSKGFDLEDHEIVTNFPRRVISELDQEMSLKDHQLFPRETVFVQLKDN